MISVSDVDISKNTKNDVLLSLDIKAVTQFPTPVLLYRKINGFCQAVIRDAQTKENAVRLPDLPPKTLEWFREIPAFDGKKVDENDNRRTGHVYALVCEVVEGKPANAYYALVREAKKRQVPSG